MTKIIVGFSRPKRFKIFAWLIMKGYSIPYDHVYVKFHSDSYERDLIYQASQTLVNFMGYNVWSEDNEVVAEFEIDIADDRKKELIQFMIDNAGKPYGIREALGLGIVRIFEILGKKIKNPFKDGEKSYVCSVLGAVIIDNFSDFKMEGDPEDIDPKEIYEFLKSKLPMI